MVLEQTNVEILGGGDAVPGLGSNLIDPSEVVLRISAHDTEGGVKVERFGKEFAPLVTSGPPGVTGYTTGRPQVREVSLIGRAWYERTKSRSRQNSSVARKMEQCTPKKSPWPKGQGVKVLETPWPFGHGLLFQGGRGQLRSTEYLKLNSSRRSSRLMS